jgi:hypothetical protein
VKLTTEIKMRRSGVGSGGGIGSRPVTHRSSPKVEPRPQAINPGGVAQLGNRVGDHTTNKGSSGYRGEKMSRGQGYATPVGISDPVKAVGVGGGRIVMKTGSQDMHGSANPGNPPAKGRDILSEFGPDRRST